MVFLGKVSFSVYLVHFAVLKALKAPADMVAGHIGWGLTLPLLYVATLMVAGGLSWLTYRWIEEPFIALGRRVRATRRAPVS